MTSRLNVYRFTEGATISIDPITTQAKVLSLSSQTGKLLPSNLLANISRNNASTYSCSVSNAVGVAHAYVILDVQWPPRFLIQERPLIEVVKGDSYEFKCGVDAKPNAQVILVIKTIKFMQIDPFLLSLIVERIISISTISMSSANSFQTKWLFNSRPIVGEDKDRLRLANIQLHHIGVYKCIVNNVLGTLVRQFTLDVLGKLSS